MKTTEQLQARSESERAEAAGQAGFSLTGPQLLLVFLGYFGLHALLRGMVSETAGIDYVDQILRAQSWSWGYGPQPPLYTWLTRIFLGIFGSNIFSIVILKESLMLALYALVYANTRLLTRSQSCALAAVAMLQFSPSIAWEAHRDLTHTVLASVLVLATIYCFLRLEPNRWISYLLFGIFGGLGVLTKYNFVMVFLALLLAGLCVQEFRSIVINRKMAVALLLAITICTPNLVWVSQHRDLAFSSVGMLKIAQTGHWWASAAEGLQKCAIVIVSHVIPMFLLLGLVFRKAAMRFTVPSPGEKALWRLLWWVLVSIALGVVLFKVTGFRDRYMQPFFVYLPILLIATLREQLNPRRLKTILILGSAVAVVILLAAPGRVLFTESLHKQEVLNWPFRKFALDLRPMVENADSIIAEDHHLAGNLRLWFPHKLVIDPIVGPLFSPRQGNTLVIWNAQKRASPPESLLSYAHSFTGRSTVTDTRIFEELLKYHRNHSVRIGAAAVQ